MSFVALVLSLPTSDPGKRTQLWRALKALGAGVLRDGLYLLPDSSAHAEALTAIAADARAAAGAGAVYTLAPRTAAQTDELRALFDRRADYAAISDEVRTLVTRLGLPKPTTERDVRAIERRFGQLSDIDFFPGRAREAVAASLTMLRAELARRAGEPIARPGEIELLDAADYRGRRWATRKRPWIDRLASAWLIKRHIDPRAKFVWLDSPRDCKRGMVGFDFDRARFSHSDGRVTYQTLLASFALAGNSALARLGDAVRYLDIGGVPTQDALGLQAVLAGVRAANEDDDRLLAAAIKVFDWIVLGYEQPG